MATQSSEAAPPRALPADGMLRAGGVDAVLALQRSAGNRAVAGLVSQRLSREQSDSDLMWQQLKETVTSPTELFSYTPLGWSKNDWSNAAKTLVGYGKGVAKVVAAPGILTYYATASLLYRSDPVLYRDYAEHDRVFGEIGSSLAEGFSSPGSAVEFIAGGFTSGLDKMNAALREGDPEAAGEGLGNFTMSVLTVAEGGQGGSIKLVFEPSTGAVAAAGMRLVLTAPPNAIPAAVTMMANVANEKGGKAPSKGKAPKNRRDERRAGDLEPGKSRQAEGDIDKYATGSGKDGSRVGDQLDMDELWHNADLVARGIAPKRGAGASRANPAVALGKELHQKVTNEQRRLGLFDPKKTSSMSVREIIELNSQAKRSAGVRPEVVQELRKEALRFAADQGQISRKELAKIAADEGWNRTLDIDLN